ncbi:MAG: hypothetical protein ACLU2J_00030 [Clostridia bacterium]
MKRWINIINGYIEEKNEEGKASATQNTSNSEKASTDENVNINMEFLDLI